MRIVKALPPNIDELDRVFGVGKMLEHKAVYFAWGDRIYNPRGDEIQPAILAHEKVHGDRQIAFRPDDPSDSIGKWWWHYINEPEFRLAEEIPAHRAEYLWHATRADAKRPVNGFRSRSEFYLQQIALRLASPTYGNLVRLTEAKRLILAL